MGRQRYPGSRRPWFPDIDHIERCLRLWSCRDGGLARDETLASAATADVAPLPTVLGGSCVILNEVPLPLIQTAPGQIPEDLRPGVNVVQVRSLMNAASSDPIVVAVQR